MGNRVHRFIRFVFFVRALRGDWSFHVNVDNYPIVAAIGMLSLLTLLGLVSGIWQEYSFVREITYWLSLGGRANTFIRGLICSEDIVYFVT